MIEAVIKGSFKKMNPILKMMMKWQYCTKQKSEEFDFPRL